MDKETAPDDARAKFLEVLERKKSKGATGSGGGPGVGSKVGGGQSANGAPKRFQRKSGSA